ncbi:uncharacterized protein EI90DRAFT_3038780 [Cantharellus anzutake]|uniref:uncharacterized protein n=1 Tax=Cantharellus anzutake TaxID=1750568 RepID=UPI0019073926|nr:uncharacterized protein EI90DRAFT_3038780 [Cantharellus anzutake]KAF8340007.1 hypothetical protein EI90DRAFT_3038780 [Cantharellus anzutake]
MDRGLTRASCGRDARADEEKGEKRSDTAWIDRRISPSAEESRLVDILSFSKLQHLAATS